MTEEEIKMPDKNKEPIVFDNVEVDVSGKLFIYYMTDSLVLINNKLGELGCRQLRPYDFRLNPDLAESVRNKMTELGVRYSMTLSKEVGCVNYYEQGKTPFIIDLKELLDPWHKAAGDGKTPSLMQQMQDMLSSKYVDSVQKTFPPLVAAVLKEDFNAAQFLMNAGVALDDSTKEGITALMFAVIKNNKEFVKLLIENGADVNAIANDGFTPYRLAICLPFADSKDRKDIAEILKKAGARTDFNVFPSGPIHEKMSFHDKLNAYISKFTLSGLGKESLIYKRCGMDKRTFNKIKNKTKHPQKGKVFSLIIGMELTLAEAEDLLSSAGYAFSRLDPFDEIIRNHIKKQDYDKPKIEEELFAKTGKTLSYFEKEK